MAEANGNGSSWLRDVAKGAAWPMLAMVLGGAVVWGQTSSQLVNLRERLDGSTVANGERLTALSLRLNGQENAIRETAITATRLQADLGNLQKSIEQRGAQRDRQFEVIEQRLDRLEESLNADRVRSARIESDLDRLVDHLLPSPSPPRGRN